MNIFDSDINDEQLESTIRKRRHIKYTFKYELKLIKFCRFCLVLQHQLRVTE